jgi:hypothetical protein
MGMEALGLVENAPARELAVPEDQVGKPQLLRWSLALPRSVGGGWSVGDLAPKGGSVLGVLRLESAEDSAASTAWFPR